MPTDTRKPSPSGSADLNATVARIAPVVLALLADGRPRSKAAIVAALADCYDRQDVTYALIRLAVTGQVEDTGGRYTLASGQASDVG